MSDNTKVKKFLSHLSGDEVADAVFVGFMSFLSHLSGDEETNSTN